MRDDCISREPLELARAIDGLTEWQKHVQTDSNINRDITVAIEALKAQLGTNLTEVSTDTISRQQAIDAIENAFDRETILNSFVRKIAISAVKQLPPVQPEKLTDIEQRIFLAAMSKEEKVCREVDKEPSEADCINLMRVCKSIERKVKGALWT